MAVLTDLGEAKFLDFVFNAGAGLADSVYLGLSATAFADDDDATTAYAKEPNTGNYARVQVTFYTATEAVLYIANRDSVVFPTASASWGTLAYWCLFDAADSTGVPIAHGALSATRTVGDGDSVQVPAGSLILSLSSNWHKGSAKERLKAFLAGTTSYYAEYPQTFYLAVGTTPFDIDDSYVQLNSRKQAVPGEHLAVHSEPWWDAAYTGDYVDWGVGGVSGTTLYSAMNVGSYERQELLFGAASTTAGVTTVSNTNDIVFPQATTDWGSIGYWAIFTQTRQFLSLDFNDEIDFSDRSIAYNIVHPVVAGSFTTAKTVNTGDVLRVNIGDFVLEAT